MAPITPSKLRADIYRLLDEVLETGEPLVITRNGRTLRIVPDPPERVRIEDLPKHPDGLIGDPEDIVHMDWSTEWKPFL